jgi:hypothetical protein
MQVSEHSTVLEDSKEFECLLDKSDNQLSGKISWVLVINMPTSPLSKDKYCQTIMPKPSGLYFF